MATTVLIGLVLILIAGYAAFFAVLNPQVESIVVFKYWAGDIIQNAPIWVLPIIGMLVGALVMAIALSGPWSTMRRAALLARQQLAAEREKSAARAKKINALSKQLEQSDKPGEDKSAGPADCPPRVAQTVTDQTKRPSWPLGIVST